MLPDLFPEVTNPVCSPPDLNVAISVVDPATVEFSTNRLHRASSHWFKSVRIRLVRSSLPSITHLQLIIGHDQHFEILQVFDIFWHDGQLIRGEIQLDQRRPRANIYSETKASVLLPDSITVHPRVQNLL